jgi:hypothetical protein
MMPAAHWSKQAGAQMPSWHGVESGMDRLVGEPYRIRHTSQCARNLGRTQVLVERMDNGESERIVNNQLA